MPRVRLGRSWPWRQAAVWGLPLALLLLGLSLGGAVGHALLALGIVLPIVLHGTVALRGIDPHLVEMARNYGLHRRMLLRRVILPGAWPQLRLGLRQTLFLLWLALLLHALILAQEGMGQAIALCVLGAVLTDGLLRAAPAGQIRRALARPEGV